MLYILKPLVFIILSLTFIGQPDGPEVGDKAAKKPAVAQGIATLPEGLVKRLVTVGTAETGDAGLVGEEDVIVDKKRGIWLRKSAKLARFPSKAAYLYVTFDGSAWTLTLYSADVRFELTADEDMASMAAVLVPVKNLEWKKAE